MLHLILLLGLNAASPSTPAQIPPPPPPPIVRDATPGEQKIGKSIIRGRVTTADGKPLRRSRVTVSAPELGTPKTVSTNTQGRYEVRDLPAGRYTVRVLRSGYLALAHGQRRPGEAGKPIEVAEGQIVERIDFALPRMSVVTGRVVDELGEPVAEAQVYAMRMRYFQGRRQLVPVGGLSTRTDDAGQYRLLGLQPGEYFVMAILRETWPLDDDPTQVLSYVPTYHPSTPTPAEAQRLRVTVGQELPGVDVQLIAGRTATVRGIAMSSNGGPLAGEEVSLYHEVRGPTSMSQTSVASTKSGGDGSFRLTNVPPGEYRLSVRRSGVTPQEQGDLMVNVAGDVDGLVLVSGTGGTVRGTIVREDGMPLGAHLERASVRAQPLSGVSPFRGNPADNGRVGRDGTFETRGVLGPSTLSVAALPEAWFVKSIELEGRNLADSPIEVGNDEVISGVRIVLTDRPSVVTGTLRDAKGQPTVEGTVVVFPAEPSKWLEGTRAIRMARPDQNGLISVRGLPPGEYLAIALDYVDDGNQYDPEFLEALRMKAEAFTLQEAETKTIQLPVQK